MKKLILLLILPLIINSCIFIPLLVPFNDLPKPTGPFHVGTRVFEWVDVLREEWFTENSDDLRRLIVQVWYPTMEESEDGLNYLDSPDQRIEPLSKTIELPEYLIRHIQDVKTNSILNASLRKNEDLYPLIMFSHGLGGMRMQNTVQMEELASRGYVVVAMDHPYDAYITVYADGSTADFRSGLEEDVTEKEFWAARIPQINTRAADLTFILDNIDKNKAEGNEIWESIDLSKVGVFGHSFGGATSVVASFIDSRIDVCINLDGWMEPVESKIIQEGLRIPFLYIGQERWIDTPLNDIKLDSLIKSSKGIKKLLKGTKHFDYSDTPQFSSVSKTIGVAGTMDIKLLREKINHEILSFFDLHLRGS